MLASTNKLLHYSVKLCVCVCLCVCVYGGVRGINHILNIIAVMRYSPMLTVKGNYVQDRTVFLEFKHAVFRS